jgi:ABC-2 type transport system ATP-binding protein
MILLDSVHKRFGSVHAVRGVSFELAPGQIVGLLGPNGAGKTTTIRMAVGYFMPDAGHVVIGGHDTGESPELARSKVGYMPESTPLYPEMRVADYLAFRGRLFGMPHAERRAAVSRVVDWCSLESVRHRRIGVLSKGFRQRVGLAAALLHDPPVLVLDEPTNGLDPSQIQEVRELVKELSSRRTMLISSHILSEVERLCDRIIVISGGEVKGDGTPAQLSEAASHGREYLVEARCATPEEAGRFAARLRSVNGVASCDAGEAGEAGWKRWTLVAHPGAGDLRERIAAMAIEDRVMIRELHAATPSLERAFDTLIGTISTEAGRP